jgi:alpha-mannosidase
LIRHLDYTRRRHLRLSERLRGLVYPDVRPVDELLVAGPVDRVSWAEAQELAYRPARPEERYGPLWATFWFRVHAAVPAEWNGRRVDLLWDSNSEAALWLDGRILQGLNPHHREAVLVERADGGSLLSFQVELACNGLFGRQASPVELAQCEVGAFDPDAWRLYHDFETLRALESEPGLDAAWAGLLRAELDTFCTVWEHDPDAAAPILAALYENRNATVVHEVAAIGHAHLDTAWLWPLAESFRKAQRTFATQTRYMDAYPEYRFACSQAQQLAWIEERDPHLWERVQAKARAGQFVPVGGSWVEPDCNLPSGESLVRQFLHGQRFFESRFGRRCREFWSPDAFGYAGQLPQIMREAGIARFLTQKLSWNRFVKPEHHTFVWQGDDGSEVLGHFPPADTYNAEASVPELRRQARDFHDHEHSRRSLLVFGHGDGGAGPTMAMLETLRRADDLQGLPRTRTTTSDEFFEALEAEPGERPVVVGELYLEYHRGTYTSQARTKRGNRRCEQALHDAEFLACARGGDYPRAELDRLWKLLLLNQFHDILPGSSIRLVYEDAERDLAEIERAADAICGSGDTPVNTTGFPRREVGGDPLRVIEAPPYGAGREIDLEDPVSVDGLTLENGQLRAELNADGTVTSLVDKSGGRETLAAPGNRLELYDDRPVDFDAWDVDPFHLQTRRDAPPAASHAIAGSRLRGEITFERELGEASRMTQTVRLDAHSRRLEFHTAVDWHEERTLLKVCFPLAVRAPHATYEMPFGYAERPTHYSTSWDRARYEVPGHRFADLSEHGFGAALLTDSKYGYSCHGNELRISLLRSPKSPDPEADLGRHEFAYALFPHAYDWRNNAVVAEAARFNAPLRWTTDIDVVGSFARVVGAGLVLDTIKRAEDSEALVVRLYEPHGGRGTTLLRVARPVESAVRANLLEDEGDALEVVDGGIKIPFRPHELVTVIVR